MKSTISLDELYNLKDALNNSMTELKEFSDFENRRVLDVNKEYIKLSGMWSGVKAKIRFERYQIEAAMEEVMAEAIHRLMHESNIAYTYTEAKQFALADEICVRYNTKLAVVKGCERLCDDALSQLKSIGWALKLHAEMTLEGLEDTII